MGDTEGTGEGLTERQGDLIASLVHASLSGTAAAANAVIESLEWDLACANAELEIIRAGIEYQCQQPWVPNPVKIMRELYPSVTDREDLAYALLEKKRNPR